MIESKIKQTLLSDIKGLMVLSASPDRRSEALSTSEELFDLPGGFGVSSPPSPLRIPENILELSDEENENQETPVLLTGSSSEKENKTVIHKNIKAGKSIRTSPLQPENSVKEEKKVVENVQILQSQRKTTYIRRLLGLGVIPSTIPTQEVSNSNRLSLPANIRSSERSPARNEPPRLSPSKGRGPGGFHSAPAASRLLRPTTASMAKSRAAISPSKVVKSKQSVKSDKHSPSHTPIELPLSPTAATLLEATRILSLVAATQPSGGGLDDKHGWRSPEWSRSRRRNMFLTPSKSRPESGFGRAHTSFAEKKQNKGKEAGANSLVDDDVEGEENKEKVHNDESIEKEKRPTSTQSKTQVPSLGSRSRISKAWIGSGMKQGEIRSSSPRGSGSYTSPAKPRGLSPLRTQTGGALSSNPNSKPKGKSGDLSSSFNERTQSSIPGKQAVAEKIKKRKNDTESSVSSTVGLTAFKENLNKQGDRNTTVSSTVSAVKRSESPKDRKFSVEKGNKVPLKDPSFDPLSIQKIHDADVLLPSDFSDKRKENMEMNTMNVMNERKGEDEVEFNQVDDETKDEKVNERTEWGEEKSEEKEEKEQGTEAEEGEGKEAEKEEGMEAEKEEGKENRDVEKKYETTEENKIPNIENLNSSNLNSNSKNTAWDSVEENRPKSNSQNNLPRVTLLSKPNLHFRNSDPGLGATVRRKLLGKLTADKTAKSKLKEDENSKKDPNAASTAKAKLTGKHSWPFNKWWK